MAVKATIRHCPQCRNADRVMPGATCIQHETVGRPTISRDEIKAGLSREKLGAIGPVPRATFAYVVGEVPRFDEHGARVWP